MCVFIVGQKLFQLMFFVEFDPTLNKDYLILSYRHLNQNIQIFIKDYAFENVVSKMSAIWLKLRCVVQHCIQFTVLDISRYFFYEKKIRKDAPAITRP